MREVELRKASREQAITRAMVCMALIIGGAVGVLGGFMALGVMAVLAVLWVAASQRVAKRTKMPQ